MQPIEFPQQTTVLAKDQPEYTPLPVHIQFKECEVPHPQFKGVTTKANVPWEMIACFELSPEEIGDICRTGKLWYGQSVFGNNFQPVRLSTQNPFEAPKEGSNTFEIPLMIEGWPDEVTESVFLMLNQAIGQSQAHAILLHLATRLKPVTHPQPDLQAFLKDHDSRKIWEKSISGAVLKSYDQWGKACDNGQIWPSNNDIIDIGNQAANAFMNSVLNEPYKPVERSPIADLVKTLNSDPEYLVTWKNSIAGSFLDVWRSLWGKSRANFCPKETEVFQIGQQAAEKFIGQLCAAGEIAQQQTSLGQ